jgi:hypothetical protein
VEYTLLLLYTLSRQTVKTRRRDHGYCLFSSQSSRRRLAEEEALDITPEDQKRPFSRLDLSYVHVHDIAFAILSTHGTTGFSRYMMGGVRAKPLRTSSIPVMWVREPDSSGE